MKYIFIYKIMVQDIHALILLKKIGCWKELLFLKV